MLYILSYIYLGLPALIFFITWLRLPYGLILSAALIVPLILLITKTKYNIRLRRIFSLRIVCLFILAVVIAYLGGSGGYVFQNGDWPKHNAVFYDLFRFSWPVAYRIDFVDYSFINYYLGWYIVPTFVGKIFQSIEIARIIQVVWTALGFFIVFQWLQKLFPKRQTFALMFFLLFATADALGIILLGNFHLFNLVTPLEHWSGPLPHEYSSMLTLMYWVPGQAIGGWICTSVLLLRFKKKQFNDFIIWIALLFFWSPLAVIGILPLTGIFYLYGLIRKHINIMNLALYACCAVVLGLFYFLYYKANMFGVLYSKGFAGFYHPDSLKNWAKLFIFIGIEAFIPISLIFILRNKIPEYIKPFFIASAVILFALPFFKYGLLNDLIMRGSIPAVFILFVTIASIFIASQFNKKEKVALGILIIYLLFGAMTPITEFNRTLVSPKNFTSAGNIPDFGDAFISQQYLGFGNSFVARNILKKPLHIQNFRFNEENKE